MQLQQTTAMTTVALIVLMSGWAAQGAPTPFDDPALEADDFRSEIGSLCRSLCVFPATLCPHECYDSDVNKRALRVSRGPNFRNIRLRVGSASSAPSSFDDYLFMKFLGQNMIGGTGAPGGHH